MQEESHYLDEINMFLEISAKIGNYCDKCGVKIEDNMKLCKTCQEEFPQILPLSKQIISQPWS